MNPREFCSLPGYTAALFLTYDFDPVFFERVVLRELWAGGTGDIVVVADRSRVDASLDRWGGRGGAPRTTIPTDSSGSRRAVPSESHSQSGARRRHRLGRKWKSDVWRVGRATGR